MKSDLPAKPPEASRRVALVGGSVHSAGARFDASAGGAGTLPRSWTRHWTARPRCPALLDPAGETLDYGSLERRSRRVAARWKAAGLAPGDRVITSAASSLDLVVAQVACLRLGLVLVPTNTAYREPELAHVVRDARPRAALVDAAPRAAWIRQADPTVRVVGPSVELPDAPDPELDRAAPGQPALIAYTSGTTGRPKGALLSHANLLAGAESLRVAWRWSPEDRLLLALPLFHLHGLGVGLFGTLHAGASAVLLRRFEAEAALATAAGCAATLFFGVPTMYHRLLATSGAARLGELRLCVSGSAPLPAELHAAFEALTGQRILERYGMTETLMLVSNPLDGERRPGSVGLPLPGVEVRLVGPSGEIQVRGPSVFGGYWERPDATAEAFTEDGWFRTGDLGELDAAGYLRIAGRAKELVISGGYNVYPREVEDALRAHPGVVDAAVVGTPCAEWGERVTAYVVGPAVPDLETLRRFLADRLASYKQPRVLHVVEALPRNALGKIQKQRLRDGRVIPEGDASPACLEIREP